MTSSFAQEASKCREQAREFAGRPEQPFLLRISEAFEELSSRERESAVLRPPTKR